MSRAIFTIKGNEENHSCQHSEELEIFVSSLSNMTTVSMWSDEGGKRNAQIIVDFDEFYSAIMSAKGWKPDREMEQEVAE